MESNWLFYNGIIKSEPDGDFIVNIHQNWFGRYDLLEHHHGYIQWLFPTPDQGMNQFAQPLTQQEAREIQANPVTRERVLMSYRLMLDFFGMQLVDYHTGEIWRSDNWRERYLNLIRSPHNYFRITRILTCLGELGYEHFKRPFLQFVIIEGLIERTLFPAMRSCRDFWIGTLRNFGDREDMYRNMNEFG